MSNLQLEDLMEQNSHERIASALGLSSDELYELDWEISANESDDGLIYEYVIHFDDSSPREILEKIDGLSASNYTYLQPYEIEGAEYYDELNWDIISSAQLENLLSNLEHAKKTLSIAEGEDENFHLLVMLHAYIVSSMEAFLSSTFIHSVTNSEQLTRTLIETEPHFREKKLPFSEIFKNHEGIKKIVADYLKRIIFHKIILIKAMYKRILNIDFGEILWLLDAVEKRHDCSHRAGNDQEGNKIPLTINDTEILINKCGQLGKAIDSKIDLISKL